MLLSCPGRGLLINELASAGGGGYVAAVNRVVAISAPANQRQARAIVVSGMTLQAESRLADDKQTLVRRTVRRVALQAVLIHRRVLIGKGPLILGMALEAELVCIRRGQIVARTAAMGIVAIHAGHLAFADRVMIGQAALCLLFLMALQALVVQRGAGLQRPPLSAASFGSMDRMTAAAFEALCGMSAGKPVPHVIGLGVAAQAGTVGLFGRAILKADDLVL